MARPEKETAVQELANILSEAKSVFVTDFKGLNVEQISEFRRKCRGASVEYRVVKNTLARLATIKVGLSEMTEHFKGPSAIAYSYDDPSAPARVIKEFAKTLDKPEIKMSVFEGEFYGPDKIAIIASLPSKDQLLARVVSGLNAPIYGLVGSLHGLLQKLVLTLDAVRSSKES
jgi:large subunit ribosomal protein L10